MIDVITQKFSYAIITPYKDYCNLSDRRKLEKKFNDNLDLLDEENEEIFGLQSSIQPSEKSIGKIFTLPVKKKKKVNYFISNEDTQERFTLDYLYLNSSKNKHQFETTKQNQILRHFGRAFSEIILMTIERSVRLHGDKLTIKLYVQTKSRGFNCIYFKKRYEVQSLTFNLKTGNFTTLNLSKKGKTNSKTFRTNSFKQLKHLIIGKSFLTPKNYVATNSRVYPQFTSIFDDLEFTTKIQNSLGIKMGYTSYSSNPESFIGDIVRKFIEFKKIKVPNGDVETMLFNYYPTEKYFKKNDRKLVASVLDMLGIKTKYTIKILHEHPTVNLFELVKLCRYFGNDFSKYIGNLDSFIFENSHSKTGSMGETENNKYNALSLVNSTSRYYLKDIEKENLIKIANNAKDDNRKYPIESILSTRFMQLIDDHFRMIDTIREYDPDIYMKARTHSEFHEEHRELTKMQTAINKGWVIEYKFSEKMAIDIEKPIPLKVNLGTEDVPSYGEDLGISFYPVILKREEDYIEEGNFMHHCVATYADKDRSIIISVRTEDGMDRVTCEFDCQDGGLIQSRHFCNKNPPVDIEHVIINDLSPKVKKYARLGLLHASEKLKVPLKINGLDVKKKEPTTPGGNLFLDLMDINHEF